MVRKISLWAPRDVYRCGTRPAFKSRSVQYVDDLEANARLLRGVLAHGAGKKKCCLLLTATLGSCTIAVGPCPLVCTVFVRLFPPSGNGCVPGKALLTVSLFVVVVLVVAGDRFPGTWLLRRCG